MARPPGEWTRLGRGPGVAVGGGPLAGVLVVAEAVAVGVHLARRGRLGDFDHVLPEMRVDDHARGVDVENQSRDRFVGVAGRHPAERRRDSRLSGQCRLGC